MPLTKDQPKYNPMIRSLRDVEVKPLLIVAAPVAKIDAVEERHVANWMDLHFPQAHYQLWTRGQNLTAADNRNYLITLNFEMSQRSTTLPVGDPNMHSQEQDLLRCSLFHASMECKDLKDAIDSYRSVVHTKQMARLEALLPCFEISEAEADTIRYLYGNYALGTSA